MSAPQNVQPCIFLDYGADAIDARDSECEICERGMRFSAHWQFTLHTVLHIALTFENGELCRIEAEGLVIECIATGKGEYRTTLAFVETPQELRSLLGKISTRLQFRPFGSEVKPT